MHIIWAYWSNDKLHPISMKIGVTWTQPCISEFDVNFGKSIVRLYYLYILFMLTSFQGDQRLIVMSSIDYLDSCCSSLK